MHLIWYKQLCLINNCQLVLGQYCNVNKQLVATLFGLNRKFEIRHEPIKVQDEIFRFRDEPPEVQGKIFEIWDEPLEV